MLKKVRLPAPIFWSSSPTSLYAVPILKYVNSMTYVQNSLIPVQNIQEQEDIESHNNNEFHKYIIHIHVVIYTKEQCLPPY